FEYRIETLSPAPVVENGGEPQAMETNQLSEALTELALDLRWAWNHAADGLWRRLDPDLWDSTGNAWFVLQTVSKEKLQAARDDPEFQRGLAQLIDQKHH